jgi:hypothetical protein
MTAIRTLLALCAAMLVTACASPGGGTADPHAAHRAQTATAAAPDGNTDPRMQAMHEMHQKMMQRMDKMQSMMEIMMERMPPATPKQ